MSGRVEVKVYNTYFTLHFEDKNIAYDIKSVISYLTSYKLIWNNRVKRMLPQFDRHWFYLDESNQMYYFPIGVLYSVLNALKIAGYSLTNDNVGVNKSIPIAEMQGKFRSEKYSLRDYQEAYQNAITEPSSPSYNLVDLKTGAGKTLIACYVITKMKERVGLVLLPTYIEKWIADIANYTDITPDRIYIVQGNDSLIKLLNNPNPDYDIIIFSIRTMSVYIKNWEYPDEGSARPEIAPYEIFNKLNIGVLLSDESHQELAALSRIILYSNVRKVLGLSATFLSNEHDTRKFQNLLFPDKTRISNIVKFDQHINGFKCPYKISRSIRIRDKRQKTYSHIVFEQSIMNFKVLHIAYLEMIEYYLDIGYLSRKKKGDKCIIFFATIDMCTSMFRYLKHKYKDLKIRRYVSEDEYEQMLEGDIIISTVKSLGTAIDIPKLISVFQTVSIKSAIANIQSAGRLRKIENVKTNFYSIYCSNLATQSNLQEVREEVLKGQVRIWKTESYPRVVPDMKNM